MTHNQTLMINAQAGGNTSSSVDVSTAQVVFIDAYVVQVGAATGYGTITPQWSNDAGTTWISGSSYQFALAAGTNPQQFAVPASPNLYRVVFAPSTGGTSCTCTAWLTWY